MGQSLGSSGTRTTAPAAISLDKMGSKTVAILGGTGNTGKWAVKGALQRGYNTRVLARNPAKVTTIFKDLFGEAEAEEQLKKVTIVKGGVMDESALEELFTGADVILSLLGMPDRRTRVVEPGIRQTLTVVRKLSPAPKVVMLSAMGIAESAAQTRRSHWCLGPLTLYCIIPGMLKDVYADMEEAEKILEEERGKGDGGIVSTIVRAPVLKDEETYRLDYTDKAQQNYIYADASMVTGIKSWRLDRQDVAAGMLDCVESAIYDNKTITVLQK